MKTLIWISSAKRDLIKLPKSVIKSFGYGLYQAQMGEYPDIAKTLKEFSGADVIELKENSCKNTFRAVYTVRFPEAIIILHVFQKKSKKGIKTPKEDIDLIKARFKQAVEVYNEWKERGQ